MAFGKISNFFGMSDDDIDSENQYEEIDNNKIVSLTSKSDLINSNKIVISEPRVYSDAKEIAKHLLSNKAVIVNFSKIDEVQSKRIIDFLAGTIFAIHGEIKTVGENIFLCTPPKFEIDSNIVEDKF